MNAGTVEKLMSLQFWDIRWKLEKQCKGMDRRQLRTVIHQFDRLTRSQRTTRSMYVLGTLCLLSRDERLIDQVLDILHRKFPESVEYALMVAYVWEQRGDLSMASHGFADALQRSILKEEKDTAKKELGRFFFIHGRAMAEKEGFKTDFADETREGVIVNLGAYRRAKKGAI